MQIRETAISTVIFLGVLVLARWLWGGPPTPPLGYFAWAAYFVGGVLVFSIVVSSTVGLFSLVGRALEARREARLKQTDAHFFYVEAAGGRGPYQLTRIVVAPALAVIDVEFRPVPAYLLSEPRAQAMRAIVNEAVDRIKRDIPTPETWVDALPGALARLGEHDLVLDGPKPGVYKYDPSVEASRKSTAAPSV